MYVRVKILEKVFNKFIIAIYLSKAGLSVASLRPKSAVMWPNVPERSKELQERDHGLERSGNHQEAQLCNLADTKHAVHIVLTTNIIISASRRRHLEWVQCNLHCGNQCRTSLSSPQVSKYPTHLRRVFPRLLRNPTTSWQTKSASTHGNSVYDSICSI